MATGEFSNVTAENAINVLRNVESVATDYNDTLAITLIEVANFMQVLAKREGKV